VKSAKEILSRMIAPLVALTAGAEPGGRPPAAVEFAIEGLLAGSIAHGAPSYSFAALGKGVLTPSPTEANFVQPQAVAEALKQVLEPLGLHKRSLTVLLPDTLVRVLLLDFDELPAKASDALSILRFRMRKILPFDVEQAGVSYQILTQAKTQTRVLVTVVPATVLAEYEELVRVAGYEPGAMLPATLAALSLAPAEGPALVASLNALELTTAITRGDDLLLYRALNLPVEENQRKAEVEREIAVAAAYYEDKMGARPETLYYAGRSRGAGSAAERFGEWLGSCELTLSDLMERPETGALTPMGGLNPAAVAGALKGAA